MQDQSAKIKMNYQGYTVMGGGIGRGRIVMPANATGNGAGMGQETRGRGGEAALYHEI